MATDTLEIFGQEWTNVAGFKATDDNGDTLTYVKFIDGNNMSYGYTDATLPYVGIAKVGQAVI